MKVSETVLRDGLRLIMWYPLRWLILILPVRVAIKFLQFLGTLHYLCSSSKKQAIRSNLKILNLSPGRLSTVVREYFCNHYVDQLFILIFPKFNKRKVNDLIEIDGLENLVKAKARNKGVVLVHGHFGPAHLPLVALSILGFPMKQLGNPSDKGLSWVGKNVAFRLRMKYEKKMPAEIIEVNRFLRPVFDALKENQIVMTTGDGTGNDEQYGVQHTYQILGQKWRMPLGPAILSLKTGATLLPLFVTPGKKKLFRIIIGEPLLCEGEGKQREIALMGCFFREYEKHLSMFPAYWHFLDRLPGRV